MNNESRNVGEHILLEAEGLAKSYGEKLVVDRLSLKLRKGMVLGLLGPNGAGKTTTLRMLYGLVDPDQGRIHFEGQDFTRYRTPIKRWIGVCTQHDTLDEDFNVEQNLLIHASYFRPRVEDLELRVRELVGRFGLEEQVDSLSGRTDHRA